MKPIIHFVFQLQNIPGAVGEDNAGVGRDKPVVGAVKERCPDERFNRMQIAGESRLGKIETVSSAGQASFFGNSQNIAQNFRVKAGRTITGVLPESDGCGRKS